MKRPAATDVVSRSPTTTAVKCRKWRPAMDHIGIDVHKRESQLCIITGAGEVVERRIRTERGRFREVLGGREQAKVLVESSTESEWVAQCLEELGHEVVVADCSGRRHALGRAAVLFVPSSSRPRLLCPRR